VAWQNVAQPGEKSTEKPNILDRPVLMCNFDISSRTRFLVNMLCHLIRYSYKIINKILFPKKNPEQA